MVRAVAVPGMLVFITAASWAQDSGSMKLFEEVWRLCLENFCSPTTIPDWQALRTKHEPIIARATSDQEASAAINAMLSELKTSHTRLYTRSDWEYYDLLDLFKEFYSEEIKKLFPGGKVTCPNIGIFTSKNGRKTFVKAVLDASPAARAGIVAGDEIRSVDGGEYDPIRSFTGKSSAAVRIQRTPDPCSSRDVRLIPDLRTPGERYLDAMRGSARIFRQGNSRVAYIHAWSFAGEEYYLELLDQLQHGKLKEADALVLDLRHGWGGANPYYISPFDPGVPTEVPSADGKTSSIDFKWKKAVVLLINEGTRSGKETLTDEFERRRLGVVVGTRTAGANVPGRPFLVSGGNLLLLSARPRACGPNSIEGKGVVPDIAVDFPLEYAAGEDPQLKAAISAATRGLKSRGAPEH